MFKTLISICKQLELFWVWEVISVTDLDLSLSRSYKVLRAVGGKFHCSDNCNHFTALNGTLTWTLPPGSSRKENLININIIYFSVNIFK